METQTKQQKYASEPKVKIGISRQIVIPKKLYDKLKLVPGDYMKVEIQGERLLLTPQMFIKKRIIEGLEDIKQGRVRGPFKTAKEAMHALLDKN